MWSLTNSITNRQMFFLLILTLTSYTTIDFPKAMAETAGRSGWILILAAALVFGLSAAAITSLNNRYQGKVLFDYSQELVGKLFSRVIAVYFFLHFLIIGTYLNIRLSDFLSANFLPRTSHGVILAVSIAVFALAAFRGITNVARLFELFGLAFLATTIMICAIMLPQGMVYNILPLVNPNEFKHFAEALPKLPFPFGGVEALFVVPFSKNNQKAPLVAFLTLIFIGFFYVLVVESTMSILGINNTMLYSDAFIEAVKVVNLPIIERTDIFYLTVSLASLFSGLIMMFLAALEFACRLFPKVQRHIMTLLIAGVHFALCTFAMGMEGITRILDEYSPYMVLVSCILIPTTLIVLSKFKDKRGGNA